MIHARFGVVFSTVMAALCWSADGSAQTVTPTDAPSSAAPAAGAPDGATPPQAAPQAPAQASAQAAEQVAQPPVEQAAPRAARKLDKAAIEGAKRAYAAGEMAYRAGDYKSAIQNFRDAQAIVPAPQAAYWLAMALTADGQVPEAIAELKALLASSTAVAKLGSEKIATANTTLDALNEAPGMITLTTEPAGATVGVDGEVRPGVTPLDVELTPGAHTLTVSEPGYQSMEFELDVPPGSKGEQALSLIALPPPPAPVAGEPQPPAETKRVVLTPTGKTTDKPSKLGTYVVFGIATAGLITGGTFLGLALGDKDETGPKRSDHIKRDTILSEIGFGAAVTFGIAGLVMATDPEESPSAACSAQNDAAHRLAFAPYMSRHGAGAAGVLLF